MDKKCPVPAHRHWPVSCLAEGEMDRAPPPRMNPRDATGLLRKAELRSPRTPRLERPVNVELSDTDSTLKEIWRMRRLQPKEWFPGNESATAETLVKGAHAQQKTSFGILATHKLKHIRSMHSPRDLYHDPPNINMEIGWHLSDDGVLPRLSTGATRVTYPKSTCAMTKHQDNMYTMLKTVAAPWKGILPTQRLKRRMWNRQRMMKTMTEMIRRTNSKPIRKEAKILTKTRRIQQTNNNTSFRCCASGVHARNRDGIRSDLTRFGTPNQCHQ